jgi:ubiquinone/menaquinone biosynthesis C-methylase UbiE
MPAPNIRDAPELYELENGAMDPDGTLLVAMAGLAPWAGRTVVDLGCGTGFWLPTYAESARDVIGVEPDPQLREAAATRIDSLRNTRVVAGSAEHLPLPESSVDVIHARFAYFFGPGADAGLAEATRVLRPGGSLVVIDNDYGNGEFADILAAASEGNAAVDPVAADRWWSERGARRLAVLSSWRFAQRSDFEAVLRNEFRDGSADGWLRAHPEHLGLSYGYVLFTITAPESPPP